MKSTKVYQVKTGFHDSDGDGDNWSSYKVLAQTAMQAISTANKKMRRGEYAREVIEICDLGE